MRIRAFIVACLLVVAACAHQTAKKPPMVVLARPDGTRVASLLPSTTPYTQGGPTATAALVGQAALLSNGFSANGVMIRSWREAGGARVQVYAVAHSGTQAPDAVENAVEIGSYLLLPGQIVPIAELAKAGAETVLLSYEAQ